MSQYNKNLKEQEMEKEIVLDLEELKTQDEALNEGLLRMAGSKGFREINRYQVAI